MTGSDYHQVTEVVIDVVLAMLRNEPGRVSAGVGGLAEENYNQVAELLGESARWLLHNLDEKYEAGDEPEALVAEMNTMFVDGFFAPDVQDSLLYLRMLTEGSDGSLADHSFGPLGLASGWFARIMG